MCSASTVSYNGSLGHRSLTLSWVYWLGVKYVNRLARVLHVITHASFCKASDRTALTLPAPSMPHYVDCLYQILPNCPYNFLVNNRLQIKGFVWPKMFHFCFGRRECFHRNSYKFKICSLLSYWPTKHKFVPLFVIYRPLVRTLKQVGRFLFLP